MAILVSSKNEEDPIEIEGARVATIQNIDFSNTQGQFFVFFFVFFFFDQKSDQN